MTGNCGFPDGVTHAHVEACYQAGRAEILDQLRAIVATPNDTQWWPVQPYMDPHDEDEVTEVQVIDAGRLRELIDKADAG